MHAAIWYSLSILGNCTYDSRRARSTLLQGGPPPSSSFLPFLVKSMCRVKALAPGQHHQQQHDKVPYWLVSSSS